MDTCKGCGKILTAADAPVVEAANGTFCSTDCLVDYDFNEDMEGLCSS